MTEMYKSRWDEIGLSDDFIFGKVMQKPKLCKKLLQEDDFAGVGY